MKITVVKKSADRTSLFYMANLGAEVVRLSAARERGIDDAKTALSRCLNIIDEYKRVETSPGGKKEAETLRRVLADFIKEKRQYSVDANQLEEYFMPFALRLQRE